MNRLLTLIAFLVMLAGLAQAERYMYAGDFLNLGVGARPLGMGGTGSTLPDEGSAPYWNPASLAMSEKSQAIAMHCIAFDGLSMYDYIGGYTKFDRWSVGGAWLRLGVDDIILTHFDDPTDPNRRPVVDSTINWSENAIYASGAYAFSPALAVGANLKAIVQGGGSYSSTGLSPDFGVYWKPDPNWDLALSVHNPGGYISWSTGARDTIDLFIRPAIRYHFTLDEQEKHKVSVALESDVFAEDYGSAAMFSSSAISTDVRAGLEWQYSLFALRGGVDRGNPTAGAGIHWQMFTADYAFLSSGELGISHRVSAGVSF
jgi:hypothetical protein